MLVQGNQSLTLPAHLFTHFIFPSVAKFPWPRSSARFDKTLPTLNRANVEKIKEFVRLCLDFGSESMPLPLPLLGRHQDIRDSPLAK
ncbi:hypothetical protein LZ554_000118 [Drepanopeziza brunnea f. sp. 'monogermtubi']|nr:hypothetical protein LZ554_000118 [Drepanopeziza brunnea f. sp. 'monogermtubi']